jgi:hypothetical protein
MNYDVQELKVIEDYKLRIKFEDNLEGIVTIPKEWLEGVFAPLKNKSLFNKVFLHQGAVSWKVGEEILDLSPHTMYREIKNNNGIYILGQRTIN